MKMRTCIFIFFLLICCPALAQKSVRIYDGYLKGEAYLQLPEAGRMLYVIGVVDGLLSSGFYGADPNEVRKLQQCTDGMSSEKIKEIVDKHVKAHRENEQDPMNVLTTNALTVACPVMKPGP